ncbi:hypothetical protein HS088_TW22G00169 [Tripterygium wilfordii]|uniref:Uncharacterized protein n=1 Tax=Tripterygium wilfordii TaxID=458696 RepID=A0A7J7BX96_TRIWF|nr:hypothetical protein HS088_TW22G00169 [Tripterygium wilfordii]
MSMTLISWLEPKSKVFNKTNICLKNQGGHVQSKSICVVKLQSITISEDINILNDFVFGYNYASNDQHSRQSVCQYLLAGCCYSSLSCVKPSTDPLGKKIYPEIRHHGK